jgi:hypothetical protein
VAVSFIGGGNRRTWRKPLTCRKSPANFITWCFTRISYENTINHNIDLSLEDIKPCWKTFCLLPTGHERCIGNLNLLQSWLLFSCNILHGIKYYVIFMWRWGHRLSSMNNIIHMTTSLSRKLNVLWIKFKIRSSFMTTLIIRVYMMFDILLKISHDRTIASFH